MLRWLRWYWKRLCKILLFVTTVAIICGGFYVHNLIEKEKCTDDLSKEVLQNLCSLYKQNELDGSFCHKLCNTRELEYESCTNYRGGKIVLFMKCAGCGNINSETVRVVFKMKRNLEERDKLQQFNTPKDASVKSMEEFTNFITILVNNSYWFKFAKDMSKEKDILSLTWGWNVNEFIKSSEMEPDKSLAIAAWSIWSLSEQQEYLFYKLLSQETFVPKLYGTCGPAYFMEFTQTLHKYEYEIFGGYTQKWTERALLAVQLIDLITKLDTDLHQPLNLCDVKPDNFGMRDNYEVTLVDTDCALFQTDLMSQFNHSTCKQHDDCDFFDCRGYCDIKRGRCLQKRMNNNLQTLCEDVFQGMSAKFPTGLLRDPPAQYKTQLFQLLQDCAYPEGESLSYTIRSKATRQSGQKLRAFLVNSIKDTDLSRFLPSSN